MCRGGLLVLLLCLATPYHSTHTPPPPQCMCRLTGPPDRHGVPELCALQSQDRGTEHQVWAGGGQLLLLLGVCLRVMLLLGCACLHGQQADCLQGGREQQ